MVVAVGEEVLLAEAELVRLDVSGAEGEIDALAFNENVEVGVPDSEELSESVDEVDCVGVIVDEGVKELVGVTEGVIDPLVLAVMVALAVIEAEPDDVGVILADAP